MMKGSHRAMFRLMVLFVALIASPLLANVRPAPVEAAASITADASRRYVDAIASDAMMGRNTPSRELDSAAQYIADEFARAGLEPFYGSYFHDFNLKRDDLDSGNAFAIDHWMFDLKDDFIPYDFTGSGTVEGQVVFAGYGVSLPDSGYDDYADIDVRGKIVFVVAGEPKRFMATGYSLRTSWFATAKNKMLEAARHGAIAILILPNPHNSRLLRPTGYPWPALYPTTLREEAKLRLHLVDSLAQ
ncbi:MAG: hypothetical protein H7X80_09000, partial [bacterium]|nr:hypothetical protein [Candidatus Kapabacteria bacterium]